ncbi:hypothetical protein GGF46_003298, partial [Coemansia sp. RSA 552]
RDKPRYVSFAYNASNEQAHSNGESDIEDARESIARFYGIDAQNVGDRDNGFSLDDIVQADTIALPNAHKSVYPEETDIDEGATHQNIIQACIGDSIGTLDISDLTVYSYAVTWSYQKP